MRTGIIGAGQIAQQHLSCLGEMRDSPVVGVCDLSAALAEATAERFGVAQHYTDLGRMLEEAHPEIVHVTTPPPTHFALASRALETAHVFVEKPLANGPGEVRALLERARTSGRVLVEDYNYVFNDAVQQVLQLVRSGELGRVLHVETFLALDIFAPGSPFVDENLPHPAMNAPGGPVSDFVTHLASVTHAFTGPVRSVETMWSLEPGSSLPAHEMRAMVTGVRCSGFVGFSAHAQPDTFTVRVHGTRMRATAGLFEPRLTLERMRGGPRPLLPVVNGLREAVDIARSAVGGLGGKLGGKPGGYQGLWRLIRLTHDAVASGASPPVTLADIAEINHFVDLLVGNGQAE